MAEKKDFYELLGVARDADQKTIKRAFLKLARKLHPDVSDDPHAEEKFKEVNEAYSVLSDEQKRANYDRYGDPNGPSGFGGGYVDMSDIFGGGFGGFGDIFDSFFGGGHGGRGAAQRTRGSDMGISLSITLEEAAAGVTKTISYNRLSTCDDCNGTGLGEGGKIEDCPRCHGTGTVVQVQNTVFGQMQSQTVCPECQGTGKKVEHACETCGGQGRTPDHERVSVEIPAGVHSGQSISITGKGEAGVRGDTSGDLIVTIEVSQHKDFERRGDDLFTSVSVDSLEAIVGTTVTIDGIIKDETIEISIPAGCKYGQQLSVAGKGMPRLHTKARGNLYVLVHIETSTGLTKDQLDTLTSLIDERKQSSVQDAQDESHAAQSEGRDSSDHKNKNAKKTSKKRR